MVGKAVYALGAVAAGAAAFGVTALLVMKKPSSAPSSSPPSACPSPPTSVKSDCSGGEIGVATILSLPTSAPNSPSWTPGVGCSYRLCATSNYKGSLPANPTAAQLGSVVVRSSQNGATAKWPLTVSSLNQWVAYNVVETGNVANPVEVQIYLLF